MSLSLQQTMDKVSAIRDVLVVPSTDMDKVSAIRDVLVPSTDNG